MGQFYLDIETTGLNPAKDKIITIQFQELDRYSGEPIGELIILKEWESSEKEILKQFISKTDILTGGFNFVPVGYNLNLFLKDLICTNPSENMLQNFQDQFQLIYSNL